MTKYFYTVNVYDYCQCCGNLTSWAYDFESFSAARDFMLEQDDAMLTTNDPIAKHYITEDDGDINYVGE